MFVQVARWQLSPDQYRLHVDFTSRVGLTSNQHRSEGLFYLGVYLTSNCPQIDVDYISIAFRVESTSNQHRSDGPSCLAAYIIITEPILYLPMDAAVGDQIQGSISGTMMNGASLVRGKNGNAIFTDGNSQYLDYGKHITQCFYNPDVCATGVTYAFWLKLFPNTVTFYGVDMGGNDYGASGLYVKCYPDKGIKLSMKWKLKFDYYPASDFPYLTWTHVVFIWERATGIRLFINGCDADVNNEKGLSTRERRTRPITRTYKFLIGADADATRTFGKMAMDEFIAWHEVLKPDEIWELFLQGGTINQVP